MNLVLISSINSEDEEVIDIIDKDNGNITVAHDVDEDYIDLFLSLNRIDATKGESSESRIEKIVKNLELLDEIQRNTSRYLKKMEKRNNATT